MSTASGMVTGAIGAGLGGTWNKGAMDYKDLAGNKLFYGQNLNQFARTVGGLAGEGLDYALGGSFDLNLYGALGMHIGTNGFTMDTVGTGVGLQDIAQAFGNMNYVGFQAGNVGNTNGGRQTITYANMGMLSSNIFGARTAMDLINGKKKIVYDLTEEGHYGRAEGDTIHLNQDALKIDESMRAKAGFYASVTAREGYLGSVALQADNGGINSYTRELAAMGVQTMFMDDLKRNAGIDVFEGGSRYQDMSRMIANAAFTGKLDGFDWESGSDLKIPFGDKEIEYYNQNFNKSLGTSADKKRNGDSLQGVPIGSRMCNMTSLAMILSDMGIDLNNAYKKKNGSDLSLPENAQKPDILEAYNRDRNYGSREFYATLARIGFDTGFLAPYQNNISEGYYIASGTDEEKKYRLNKIIGQMGNYYETYIKKIDENKKIIKDKYLALMNYMGRNDGIIMSMKSDSIKIGTGASTYILNGYSHVVALAGVTETGIWIRDPYGTFDPDYGGYKARNDSAKEYDNQGLYFMTFEQAYKYKIGENYIYLKYDEVSERLRRTKLPTLTIDNYTQSLYNQYQLGQTQYYLNGFGH